MMVRNSLALAAAFVAILSAGHVVAHVLVGIEPFAHSGTDWPPPVPELVLFLVIGITMTRGLIGIGLGACLAACARARRSTSLLLAIGAVLPAISEAAFLWADGRHIIYRGDVARLGLWRVILENIMLQPAIATAAGLATAWWARSLRDAGADGKPASVRISRRGWTRLTLGTAAVAGLLGCYRFVQLVNTPPPKPRPPVAAGKIDFSFEALAGRSERAILSEQSTTLLCASAALGLVGIALNRRPSS